MKQRISILSVITLLLGLVSCEKNNDNNPGPNPVTPDSNYVNKIYLIKPNATGEDTTQFSQFHFDSQKRVTWLVDSTYSSTGVTAFFVSQYFEYHGSDTLPFKKTYIIDDAGFFKDTTITYYTYNAAGLRIRDSIYSPAAGTPTGELLSSVVIYEYAPNKIYAKEMSANGLTLHKSDTLTMDAAGNMIESITQFEFTPIARTVTTYGYDNKPNPFKRLNIFKARDIVPNGSAEENFMQVPNNIISVNRVRTSSPSGTTTENLSLTMTYNSNGYPVIMYIPNPPGSSTSYIKYLLEYQPL